MKLTELEAERFNHIATRRQLVSARASEVERDAADLIRSIAARGGLALPLTIDPDGTVSGAPPPSAEPDSAPPDASAPAE